MMMPEHLPNAIQWDLTQAPFHADPTGKSDSTQAIVAAMNAVTSLTLGAFGETLRELDAMPTLNGYHPDGFENRKENGRLVGIFAARIPYAPTLFLPEGEYLVSDTLCYTHANLTNSGKSELNAQIRLRGAGAGKTIIRLADNAEAFQGEAPKPIVSVMKGERTNVAMSNYVEDLSIDVGSGNPAAVGLDFYANNSGCARNLEICCPDGQAARGLMLGHNNYSGILLRGIRIRGFKTGLHLDSGTATMFMAAEDIEVSDCKVGVFAGRPSMSLSNIRVSGAETGVVVDGAGGLLVLIDSELEGNGPQAIDRQEGMVYLANVTVRGFDGDAVIDEQMLPEQGTISGGMPRLPVENPPAIPASESRCVVDDFGAVPDGKTDATAAIQKALDSGAAEVHFGPGKYLLDGPVTVPGTVQRLAFHFADLVAGPKLRKMHDQGAFVISGESDQPLLFEDLFGWEQWSGEHVTIDHACTRTLVIEDVHTQTLPLYKNSVRGGKVFLENVACTAGVIPGTKDHDRICLRFYGQQVWARQVNPERGEPMALNDGGTLWVLGFKTEDDATAFHTVNGGQTEVLGGVLNCGGHRYPSFLAEDSSMRVVCTSNGWALHNTIRTAIREVRDGEVYEVLASKMPDRGVEHHRGPQFIIPIYVSPALESVEA